MAKLIEKIYGDALFETAVENNKADELYDEARQMVDVLNDNDEIKKLLSHPKVSKEDKISFIESVFKGRISEEILGLIVLMIKKNRQMEIAKVFAYFINKIKEYKKIGTAYVTTAVELNEKQKESIVTKLKETTSYEEFEMIYALDADLIGGMIIRIGDRVVDSSIRTKINNLSKDLYNIQLT